MKIDHIGIIVKDADRSIDFYTKALGFKLVEDYRDERVRLVFVELAGLVVEFIQYIVPPNEERGKGIVDHIAFTVDDLEAALEQVKAYGATLLFDAPRTVGKKKIFFFAGPDGERLEFCQILK